VMDTSDYWQSRQIYRAVGAAVLQLMLSLRLLTA